MPLPITILDDANNNTKISALNQVDELAESQASAGIIDFNLPDALIPAFEKQGIQPKEIENIIGPREQILRTVNALQDLDSEQTDRATRLAH